MTDRYREAMRALAERLKEYYIYPEVGERLATLLMGELSGKYDGIADPRQFADRLTDDLYEVHRDRHVRVRFHPGEFDPAEDDSMTLTPDLLEEFRREGETTNFGFQRVERLPGNVGYIDIRTLMPAEVAGETAAAAFNFVSHTNALILDLRQNGGGVPSMVSLICGYLFCPAVHLDSMYWRKGERIEQTWSLPYVPGRHYGEKPVYVLTSRRTFSGAEDLAYTLKQYRRGVIVGETTLGGANPGKIFRLTEDFVSFIPMGRAIHPITGTNWEGVGVEPDVAVDAEHALTCAYERALQYIASLPSLPDLLQDEVAEKLSEIQNEK
ncbi:S41 family peptidase [Alicyclobacillus dauci]|uniref:S41 family peptidase n=1 Tax=Alicyclobacillus dauci TaxID=1475485 RepID=A0ABY6Z3J6_9BACL|nr:S41 family peptidase [Alicyclobacillus dauci]WAH37198.1 S41 family peptidase [Alicyclobacillus dauci]